MATKIEIDFNSLKYNLYELLNVGFDAPVSKIKKSFITIIKTFHPDKSSQLEEDIFNHIILANQILTNEESRRKYNDYIYNTAESHDEIKKSFNKSVKNIEQYFPPKEQSNVSFKTKINDLNKKHGYNTDFNSESVMSKFNKLKDNRNNIKIQQEDFKTNDEFNDRFNKHKSPGGKFDNQLLEYNEQPGELSTYVMGEQYTSIKDLDKLYIEDTIQSSKYSSLDRAFMLHPVNKNESLNKTIEQRMKEYETQTEQYKNSKPTDYSTKKFDEW